ncbi:MAG: DUF1295 domain-containing protein [Pseudomonadota bacterium]
MSKTKSILVLIWAYSLALIAGWWVADFWSPSHPIYFVAIADVVATLVVFAFSFTFRNSSLYDPYWSVIPIAIAAYWLWEAIMVGLPVNSLRQWILLAVVSLWGLRLTFNFARGWPGLVHADWRYVDLADKHGKRYWLVSFFGVHFMPTVLVFLGMVPVYFAMNSSVPLGVWDALGVLIAVGGTLIETIADEQLRQYRKEQPKDEPFLRSGLWRYSRHPNYFGEISLWVGLFVSTLGLSPTNFYWTGAGALAMIVLFIFVSIPMIDKRMVGSKPGYEAHMQKVSALIPWFSRY